MHAFEKINFFSLVGQETMHSRQNEISNKITCVNKIFIKKFENINFEKNYRFVNKNFEK